MLKTYKKLVAASKVGSGYYLHCAELRSLLSGLLNLFLPFPGTIITKFVCANPRTDNIIMVDFAECGTNALVDLGGCP